MDKEDIPLDLQLNFYLLRTEFDQNKLLHGFFYPVSKQRGSQQVMIICREYKPVLHS